jgi:transcription-repair coupling factor (superfamily II helicase)
VALLKGEAVAPIIDVAVNLDFIDLSSAGDTGDRTAAIPADFIEDEALRVSIYRKIAALSTEKEVDDLYIELRDRFGPLPDSLDRLLKIARLRIVTALRRIQRVDVSDGKVMLTRDNDYLMPGRRFPRLASSSPSQRLDELISMVKGL